MQIKNNEQLEQKLRGVRTLLSIIGEAPQGFKDFEWALMVLGDSLDECIKFVESDMQKEDTR